MATINWNTTKEEDDIIIKIVERAKSELNLNKND